MTRWLDRFWTWLQVPVAGTGLLSFFTTWFLVHVVVVICGILTIHGLGLDLRREGAGTLQIDHAIIPMMIGGALIEEFFFRLLPLGCALSGGRLGVFATAIISSAVFGWIHGDAVNILVQGAGGLVYCIVFLKCSTFGKDLRRGLYCSAGLHAMFNLLCVALALSAGRTTI